MTAARSLYLLLGLAAACGQSGVRPPTTVEVADTADQVMQGVRHFASTPEGVRRSLVEADTAYYFEPTQTFELRRLRVTFYNANGAETSIITADEGTYRQISGSMEARGEVEVRSPQGDRRLTTDRLVYDQPRNELSSDRPFRYRAGSDVLEGNGFTSDPDFRNVNAKQPRGVAGSGSRLPGQ